MTHTGTHAYTCSHIHMSTLRHTHAHAHTHPRHTCIHMLTHIHVSSHIYTCACTHAEMCAHSSAAVPCPLLQDHHGQRPGFSVLWNLLFIMLSITTIRPRSLLRGAGLCLFPHSENCILPGSHAAPTSRSLGKAEVLCCRRNWAQGLYLFLLSFHGLFPFLHLFS